MTRIGLSHRLMASSQKTFLYPPVDQSSLESMIRYTHQKKKYDGHQLQHFRIFNKSLLPGKFVPIETMCHLM